MKPLFFRAFCLFVMLLSSIGTPWGFAAEMPQGESAKPVDPVLTTEQLVRQVRPSLVSISVIGREGSPHGLGTGFVVSSAGLIATNLHVVGEGHRFSIELSDGRSLPVKAVHASDHGLDLAVIQVDPQGSKLAPLPLGDSSAIPQGAPVAVMGNPLGLKHSVVAGVVSAKREVSGRPMLQLAIPIEPGNSGGPVLDMQGRVVGLVNMKSTVDVNLGFAIEVNSLKSLLERPNPIPIARWTTIGGMDAKKWQPLFGAEWRQRGGRILVRGTGSGFGGRSVCLYQLPVPEAPFELAVDVKLSDESGAAGLVFHADGADKHYGFYPSNGNLRLTCFDGPSVYQWQVLKDQPSQTYRPGDWNRLRIRVDKEKFQCFVNEQVVFESRDSTFSAGKVGLAKFRHTEAEFRNFQIGQDLAKSLPDPELVRKLILDAERVKDSQEIPVERLVEWAQQGDAAVESLEQAAKILHQRAQTLERLARDVHVRRIVTELAELVQDRDEGFDLLRGALLLSRLDSEDIDVEAYVQEVDRMAAEILAATPADADELAKQKALDEYLFRQNGFHGARFEYYHRANSYINRVIDDRAGLPITLSVLYLELARRLGLKVEGVGLPSHFVVRFVPSHGDAILVDVHGQGRVLSLEDAAKLVRENGFPEMRDEYLVAQKPRDIVLRMLNNLKSLAEQDRDVESWWRYYEAEMAITPQSGSARLNRALLRAQTGRVAASLDDLEYLIDRAPPGIDVERVRELRDHLLRRAQ